MSESNFKHKTFQKKDFNVTKQNKSIKEKFIAAIKTVGGFWGAVKGLGYILLLAVVLRFLLGFLAFFLAFVLGGIGGAWSFGWDLIPKLLEMIPPLL